MRKIMIGQLAVLLKSFFAQWVSMKTIADANPARGGLLLGVRFRAIAKQAVIVGGAKFNENILDRGFV